MKNNGVRVACAGGVAGVSWPTPRIAGPQFAANSTIRWLRSDHATLLDAEGIRFAIQQNRESLNLYDIEDLRKNRFETIAALDQPCQRQSAPIFAVCQNHAGMFRRKT